MSDARNLLQLLNSAPKDERNVLIPDSRTDAFFDALAKAKPLTPVEILEAAETLNRQRSPFSNAMAVSIFLGAIGAIGHDRHILEILSKVADEQTSWGVPTRELLARITKSHQAISRDFLGGFAEGTNTGGGGGWTYSTASTPPGSGCTYTPPSGSPVTLAPKQQIVFDTGYVESEGAMTRTIITVTCWNLAPWGFPPNMRLFIETAHFYQ